MAAQPGLTNNNQNINTGWSGEGGDRGWSYGESPFGFDVAANNANAVIFGDFGFVHKTTNGGQKWQQAYVAVADQNPANQPTPTKKAYHSVGLENTTCWQVHWPPTMWPKIPGMPAFSADGAGRPMASVVCTAPPIVVNPGPISPARSSTALRLSHLIR